jgi:SM-20-related protein
MWKTSASLRGGKEVPGVINFDALRTHELETHPFNWAFVTDALDSAHAAFELQSSFPREDFWIIAGGDAEKDYSYAARPLVTLGNDRPAPLSPLAPAWEKLVEDLLSSEYRLALAELTRLDLDDALMEASVWRWDPDAHLGPHRDLPDKLVTHVLYLAPEWDSAWGGCLRILGSEDGDNVVAELPPRLGTASVLLRSERSWHSVTPVQDVAAEPRRSVIVTWFVPGSVSPVWGVDGRRGVTCTAGGVREDAGLVERASHRARHVARRARARLPSVR